MSALALIALFAAIPAAWLMLAGGKQLLQRHVVRAGFQGGMGLGLAGIAAITGSLGLNVYGYQRLTWEAPVAEVHVLQALANGWLVTLTETGENSGARPSEYIIQGDQWRLEANVIKWDSWANVLGLDSQYRLERISGRFKSAADSRRHRGSAYDLSQDAAPLLDRIPSKWRPWVDSEYGNGVYMPLQADTRYTVSITQSGLIARPAR